MYQSILTSLMAGTIILIVLGISELLRRFPAGERVYRILLASKKTIIYFLLFILFSLPILFSVPTGVWLSPSITASFVREVFVSVIIFASFYISWKAFNISRTQAITSLNEMLVQWDAGEVSDTKVKKEQILHSLHKWIEMRDEAGWYELREQIYGKLTDTPASWIIMKELNSIQQQKTEGHTSVRNHNYEKRLESLVVIESVGTVWQKWDNGLVSETVAHEALEVNAFRKWILNDDETGWADLDYIFRDRKSLTPKVIEIAEYELREIAKRKKRHEAIDSVIEKRLEKLVLV